MKDYAHTGPGAESVYNYEDGGFHPVNIGDVYNDRYRVVRKLGFGSYSTVWLVEDLALKRFSSLKVVAAEWGSGNREASVLMHLKSQQEWDVTHPGLEHVVKVFDTFSINGPNGMHHCIVTEVLGISLAEDLAMSRKANKRLAMRGLSFEQFRQYRWPFAEDVTKKLAAQIALGVAYLHKCGVIHGDLHLGNVLLYSPVLQTASSEELDRIYGPPRSKPILYVDKTPVPPSPRLPQCLSVVKTSQKLFKLCLLSAEDIHFKLCDFGEASIIGLPTHTGEPFKSHVPTIFAAPEILFKDISELTTSMDIWALGVLLHMMINCRSPPFYCEYELNNEIIAQIVRYLGKPHDEWWTKWADRSDFFDDNGIPLEEGRRHSTENAIGIDSRLEFSKDERELFSYVLRKIFRYKPEERIDAEGVVRLLPQGWVGSQALGKLSETVKELS